MIWHKVDWEEERNTGIQVLNPKNNNNNPNKRNQILNNKGHSKNFKIDLLPLFSIIYLLKNL